jgi:hypothetical protein
LFGCGLPQIAWKTFCINGLFQNRRGKLHRRGQVTPQARAVDIEARMRSPSEIAEKFSTIDVHDDTIEAIEVTPAVGHASCRVKLILYRHWQQKRRALEFIGCANVNIMADTTVLLNNAPNNTCGVEAFASVGGIVKIMRSQKKEWNVTYQKRIDPLPIKIASAAKYVLFRLRLFGGNLEIIAKSFRVTRLTLHSKRTRQKAARPSF